MRILVALTRYGQFGEGDVKQVFFDRDTPGTARIHGIDNRGQAY
jgi:hypothetical protein